VKTSIKLLFSAISVAFAIPGVLAIISKAHTGYSRFVGIRTLFDDEAVWFGQTSLLLA
jgi:hypothetical protein